jgi:hypothetical protein
LSRPRPAFGSDPSRNALTADVCVASGAFPSIALPQSRHTAHQKRAVPIFSAEISLNYFNALPHRIL